MDRKVIILADDLTGAQDTAIAMLKQGMTTQVSLSVEHLIECWATSDAWALTTESRFLDAGEAFRRTFDSLTALNGRAYALYKKVDSTLRGNIGAEIAAVLAATNKRIALVAPALPHSGRTIVGGMAFVDGVPLAETECGRDPFTPVLSSDVREIIACQTNLPVRLLPLDVIREGGERLVAAVHEAQQSAEVAILVCDAETDADLAALDIFSSDPNVLYVGSSGLLSALTPSPANTIPAAPFLMVVGSLNSVSQAQADAFVTRATPLEIVVDGQRALTDAAGALAAASASLAEAGDLAFRHILLRCAPAPSNGMSAIEAGRRIADCLSAAALEIMTVSPQRNVFATGGDMSAHLLAAAGAKAVRLAGEAEPGIPFGFIVGGRLDGTCLVSKAGGFGEPDALSRLTTKEKF
ncbi:four-carbon acid sugar kinase family protein [Consotaella salsifontis]|uniref:Uncharacterized conserved protein YgbK, DUF1537 family n=1 Tax=Consotaella salsifontis TaxID=1365950 RepID=A0A1T4T2J4_9HYPH|nr:four-carbon acid sugar kinase family protein [Consotaella salsifontis]SKA34368.1 Uncharacterized conserved protein YgbK, DUF1537 family [Consotaella salsifontis]